MTFRYIEQLIERRPLVSVCKPDIERFAAALITCYRNGGKVLVCGNGGSCSDAGHIVGELMKGFHFDRPPLRAIDLTAQNSLITAIANDLGADRVFAQQVLGYADKSDVFIGISTSGNSANVNNAAEMAKEIGAVCVGLTGATGGAMKRSGLYGVLVCVPETETFRVQEEHIAIYHAVCADVESIFNGKAEANSYREPRNSCPICGSFENTHIFTQRFAPVENTQITESYDVCRCERCGMVFANNIPSQAYFDAYYMNCNKYESLRELSAVKWNGYWHKYEFDFIKGLGDTNLRICDIGCGQGELLIRLSESGFSDLYAVDTSEINRGYISGNGINVVRVNSLFELTNGKLEEDFDIIVFSAVLEHIVDLREAIGIFQALQANDGILVVTVPIICGKDGVISPFQNFSLEHINYFTPATLISLMGGHGYELDSIVFKNDTVIVCAFRKDNPTLVDKYISASSETIRKSLDKVQHLISANKSVYIWGAGSLTRQLVLDADFAKLNIIAFVDSETRYQGKTLCNCPILSPTHSLDPTVLIIIVAYRDAEDKIRETIEKMGIKNDVFSFLSSE
jgi:D-sedoheptulose 7-phosphate isomerase